MVRKILSAFILSVIVIGITAFSTDAFAGGRGNHHHGHRGGNNVVPFIVGTMVGAAVTQMAQPRYVVQQPAVYAPAPQQPNITIVNVYQSAPQVTRVPPACAKFIPDMDLVDACMDGLQSGANQSHYQQVPHATVNGGSLRAAQNAASDRRAQWTRDAADSRVEWENDRVCDNLGWGSRFCNR